VHDVDINCKLNLEYDERCSNGLKTKAECMDEVRYDVGEKRKEGEEWEQEAYI
jgi:hypothetical protein